MPKNVGGIIGADIFSKYPYMFPGIPRMPTEPCPIDGAPSSICNEDNIYNHDDDGSSDATAQEDSAGQH